MPDEPLTFLPAPLATTLIAPIPIGILSATQVPPLEAALYYGVFVLLFAGVSAVWFALVVPLAEALLSRFGLLSRLHLIAVLTFAAACASSMLAAALSLAPRSELSVLEGIGLVLQGAFHGVASGVMPAADSGSE